MSELEAEVHAIKQKIDGITKGNWLQRNSTAVISMIVYSVSAIVFIVTIGAQVSTNTHAIELKADADKVQLELDRRDQKIETLEESASKTQTQNERLFEKLESKIDQGNRLLQQILREMPRKESSK